MRFWIRGAYRSGEDTWRSCHGRVPGPHCAAANALCRMQKRSKESALPPASPQPPNLWPSPFMHCFAEELKSSPNRILVAELESFVCARIAALREQQHSWQQLTQVPALWNFPAAATTRFHSFLEALQLSLGPAPSTRCHGNPQAGPLPHPTVQSNAANCTSEGVRATAQEKSKRGYSGPPALPGEQSAGSPAGSIRFELLLLRRARPEISFRAHRRKPRHAHEHLGREEIQGGGSPLQRGRGEACQRGRQRGGCQSIEDGRLARRGSLPLLRGRVGRYLGDRLTTILVAIPGAYTKQTTHGQSNFSWPNVFGT